MTKDFNEFSKWLYSHEGWRAWDRRKAEIDKAHRNRGICCNDIPDASIDEHRLMFILSEYHKQVHTNETRNYWQ